MTSRVPIVVLDACILYPAALRNLMMWLAVHDVIKPRWTDQIHEEWMRNVLKDHPDLTREKLMRTRQLMDANAEDCLITDYEKHISGLILPDPDDRHVLAAAIECAADAIVTWNLADFPAAILDEHGLDVLTPDQLICGLLDSNPESLLAAMKEHRSTLKNPPKTPSQYLDDLLLQGLARSVKLFQEREWVL
jgi:predicted nucleic acid-binding protein